MAIVAKDFNGDQMVVIESLIKNQPIGQKVAHNGARIRLYAAKKGWISNIN